MKPLSQPSAETGPKLPATLTAQEESAARRLVEEHRARLDWLLRVPEFEALHREGMRELGLSGQRQGIGLRAAVMALPLENRFQLVGWSLKQFRGHLPSATAQAMCRVAGVERFNALHLDQLLTTRQWADLRARVQWRLAREHARYKRAQQLLFTGFRQLVHPCVNRLVFDVRHRADCIQEGMLGLLRAIDRSGGDCQDFAAYARIWIKRAVRNYLMRQRLPVYAPVNLISEASRAQRDPVVKKAGSVESGDVRLRTLILECLRTPAVSIDEPIFGGSSLREELWDPVGTTPAEETDRADLRGLVDRLLEHLTAKQRVVLRARYGLEAGRPQTLAEIARRVGISHQQVSMREKRAMEKLQAVARPLLAELWDG